MGSGHEGVGLTGEAGQYADFFLLLCSDEFDGDDATATEREREEEIVSAETTCSLGDIGDFSGESGMGI